MAKSIRSSTKKRNHAKLRSTVFGPAADARTERLSAKLQELAAQPLKREETAKDNSEQNTKEEAEEKDESDKMAIDESATSLAKAGFGKQRGMRVRKQFKRKPRNAIVFPKPQRKNQKKH